MYSTKNLPYLLCEIANVHGGDKATVDQLISQFGELKYPKKGIKHQVFHPDSIALEDYKWFPVYKELTFSEPEWKLIITDSSKYGDVWIDVFDVYSIKVIKANLPDIHGIKLQASVLENMEVLDQLRQIDLEGKHLIINVSGYGLDAIAQLVVTFSNVCKNLILQIGFQSYPTTIENTGLQKIPIIKTAFPDHAICMADHADATSSFALHVPVYAALLGCTYIEKHFCISRKDAKYDGFSALEGAQMDTLCISLHNANLAIHGQFVSSAEMNYLEQSIQIPVLRNDVEPSSLLSASDYIYRRTSQIGLKASEICGLQRERMVLAKPKYRNSAVQRNDYRQARIAIIVAGRMKSTRLANKAILPIAGIPSVERCLRQCTGVRGIDRVILATSNLESDDVLESYLLGGAVSFWRGDPDDVIGRYLGACEYFGVDVVIRITADCPLVLPEIVEYLLDKHFEAGSDYTAAIECAVGTSAEIINTSALRKVANHFGPAEYSEYMTWYFMNNPDCFKLNLVSLPRELIRNYRMTLDYAEDITMFEALFSRLSVADGVQSAAEVFSILDNNPDIAALNAHLTLRYRTDQDLISRLNLKTKINI